MTKDRYLEMMEQLGKEPIPDEVPPDYEDFPPIVLSAIDTFNGLGDRIYGDVGYTGKDYTNLPYFMEIHHIKDKELFLEVLLRLDSHMIQESGKRLKAEMDKAKRKGASSGR